MSLLRPLVLASALILGGCCSCRTIENPIHTRFKRVSISGDRGLIVDYRLADGVDPASVEDELLCALKCRVGEDCDKGGQRDRDVIALVYAAMAGEELPVSLMEPLEERERKITSMIGE